MSPLALCPPSPGKTRWLTAAASIQVAAVALGALGAHGDLRDILEAQGRVDTWHTAVLYHLVHGLALFGLAIWLRCDDSATRSRLVHAAGWCWLAGILCFSGSLYLLALGGPRWLGPVTPLGGLAFLSGWAALAVAGLRSPPPKTDAR